MEQIWSVAFAVLVSLGGGAAIVFGMSSWLGKVWANRILEGEKAKYQAEFARLKSDLDKRIHEHNVAVTRIDAQRVTAIKHLYGALISWNEAAIQVRAPNKLHTLPAEAIETYRIWGNELRARSENLEKLAVLTAIDLSEETYTLVATCGLSASLMSIAFNQAIYENPPVNPVDHLARIEDARTKLEAEYQEKYEPARLAVLSEFRRIIDPRISVGG